jgi:hypothetical protein
LPRLLQLLLTRQQRLNIQVDHCESLTAGTASPPPGTSLGLTWRYHQLDRCHNTTTPMLRLGEEHTDVTTGQITGLLKDLTATGERQPGDPPPLVLPGAGSYATDLTHAPGRP